MVKAGACRELRATPTVNRPHVHEAPCLFEACSNGELQLAARALDQDPSLVKARDDFEDTALHLAASTGELDIMRLLIKAGADVNAENKLGVTPLCRAAAEGHVAAVQLLLEAGADVEHQDSLNGSPLHVAARRNYVDTAALLLERGARADSTTDVMGNTPLHAAASEGCTATVKVLLSCGANPQAVNRRGRTPLSLAQDSWVGSVATAKISDLIQGSGNCGAKSG